MDIRDLLLQVASTYDSKASTTAGTPAQDLLRAVPDRIGTVMPAGMEVEGYGGKGGATATPWIGVFNPDVTRDPKENLYLAYIFASDLESVSLTLQQGVTRLHDELKTGQKLRARLEQNAERLRRQLPNELVKNWSDRPSFQHNGWRALAYEASSVAARNYEVANMPPESALRKDLWSMAEILQRAATIEKTLWYESKHVGVEIEYVGKHIGEVDPLDGFRPKSDSDYIAEISARQQVKKRRHESLIASFGPYVADRGFKPVTTGVHPRDLVLLKGVREWLVEVKVVKSGNPTQAVREALAQLLEYRHFLYVEQNVKPSLVALFTESVGVYAKYLESHGIASVWKALDGWEGSASAVSWGLVPER